MYKMGRTFFSPTKLRLFPFPSNFAMKFLKEVMFRVSSVAISDCLDEHAAGSELLHTIR